MYIVIIKVTAELMTIDCLFQMLQMFQMLYHYIKIQVLSCLLHLA